MDDNCYAGKNAHKEISMNNRIANKINKQRIFSEVPVQLSMFDIF